MLYVLVKFGWKLIKLLYLDTKSCSLVLMAVCTLFKAALVAVAAGVYVGRPLQVRESIFSAGQLLVLERC